MGGITLAFLWHMHQPYYVEAGGVRATLPWTRLHALKDYLDLPAIARRFPRVPQTFNLVPSLLDQLDGYVAGLLTDPFLDAARRDAAHMSADEKAFLLREFFSFSALMGRRFPRLEQLQRLRGSHAPGPDDAAALGAWREEDLRDLQVLFHLAWSGPVLSARPFVAGLIEKGSGYTREDLAALLETQRAFLGEVLPEYRRGAEEGTLEISATPYYHPILPLLCDSDAAREATPRLPLPAVPFRHPEDARLQVREARRSFQRRFGSAPPGMWPSEGAISDATLAILAEEGVQWTASDEDLLFASLGAAPQSADGRSRLLHRPWLSAGGTLVFFRDHLLSDRIGFVYSSWEARAAADDFVGRLRAIADASGDEQRVVSVILDGENAWEHYPGNGEPFLSALFGRIADTPWIRARTFSAIAEDCRRGVIACSALARVRAGSWIRADLTTWIGDPAKNRAWEKLAEARDALGAPDPSTPAGTSLLAAEGSDWFWWFGDEHSSAHDADFDRTFRGHLERAYVFAGKEAPMSLGEAVASPARAAAPVLPTGPVRVVLDGRATDWFEWIGAGRADADLGRGTMARGERVLRALLYGNDDDRLALRLDTFSEPASAALDGLAVVVELRAPVERRLRVPLRPGECDADPVRASLGQILEMTVPLLDLDAVTGTRLDFRVLLEDGEGHALETLPGEGFLGFPVGTFEPDWIV